MSRATDDNKLAPALKSLALLLAYPDAELRAHARELEPVFAACAELDADDHGALAATIAWLSDSELLEAQATFVETFDRGKKVSLYLFEHVYGESRDRGPAMVELGHAYREQGLEIDSRELPDYLPMFLEFTALLPEVEARTWLLDVSQVLQRIHVRLAARQSPYAAFFRVLLKLLALEIIPEEMGRIVATEKRDDTPAALDSVWEEAPVSFGAEQPQSQCGTTRQAPSGAVVEQPLIRMDGQDAASGPGNG